MGAIERCQSQENPPLPEPKTWPTPGLMPDAFNSCEMIAKLWHCLDGNRESAYTAALEFPFKNRQS